MTEEQESLILQKGTYPYECMDSFEKFDETQLPPIEKFFSTLVKKKITNMPKMFGEHSTSIILVNITIYI